MWNYARPLDDETVEVMSRAPVDPYRTRRQLLLAALLTLLLAWMAYNTYDQLDMAKFERLKEPLLELWSDEATAANDVLAVLQNVRSREGSGG